MRYTNLTNTNKNKSWPDRLGPNQKKSLLLLAAGMGLSLSSSPKSYFKVIKSTAREWRKINHIALRRAIVSLYRSQLIEERDNSDGSVMMVLSQKGRQKVLTFDIDNIIIKKPTHWDKQWRVILFDIPESKKKSREALRETLKRLGFYEFQKSVFIFPYECQKELDFIIEFYRLRPYVRMLLAHSIDNEVHLKTIFDV